VEEYIQTHYILPLSPNITMTRDKQMALEQRPGSLDPSGFFLAHSGFLVPHLYVQSK
jgi:hypothetical protein